MPRHDIYGPIHKALRLALSNLLVKLGSTDFECDREREEAVAALRRQLAISAGHLAHEEEFLHKRLEERASESTAALEADHRQHDEAFAKLEALLGRLEAASPGERAGLGRALYLGFSGFVAEDFEHMLEEETRITPLLHELFSDAELIEIEGRIVGSVPPEEMMAVLRLMMPALNPTERIDFLSFARASAPPEAFEAMLRFGAQPALNPSDWERLVAGLGVAADLRRHA